MKKTLEVVVILICLLASQAEAAPKPASPDTPSVQGQLVTSHQDLQIDELMTVSGMKDSLQKLPNQMIESAMRSSGDAAQSEEVRNGLMQMMSDAYPQDGFLNRTKQALNNNYDEQRFARLIQTLSSPLAKRMAELENQEPSPAALQSFVAQIAKQHLPAKRVQLIQRMDAVSGASAMSSNVTITTLELMALAAVGDCPELKAKIKKTMAKQRGQLEKATRASTQMVLAFTYRDVSDADLGEYIKTYQSKDGKWLQGITHKAMEEQFNFGAEVMAKGVEKVRAFQNRNQSMFTPKCGDKRPAETADIEPQLSSSHKAAPAKLNRDARNCLNLKDDKQIMACAEKYH